jgi:hypothetical protein
MIGLSVTLLIHSRNDHVNDASRPPTRRAISFCALEGAETVARRRTTVGPCAARERVSFASTALFAFEETNARSEAFSEVFSEETPRTFSSFIPARIANLLRTSRSRRPSTGASTVTANAATPAFSARSIRLFVIDRSSKT